MRAQVEGKRILLEKEYQGRTAELELELAQAKIEARDLQEAAEELWQGRQELEEDVRGMRAEMAALHTRAEEGQARLKEAEVERESLRQGNGMRDRLAKGALARLRSLKGQTVSLAGTSATNPFPTPTQTAGATGGSPSLAAAPSGRETRARIPGNGNKQETTISMRRSGYPSDGIGTEDEVDSVDGMTEVDMLERERDRLIWEVQELHEQLDEVNRGPDDDRTEGTCSSSDNLRRQDTPSSPGISCPSSSSPLDHWPLAYPRQGQHHYMSPLPLSPYDPHREWEGEGGEEDGAGSRTGVRGRPRQGWDVDDECKCIEAGGSWELMSLAAPDDSGSATPETNSTHGKQ
ncbi:unnamed protein product [Discosporangium mesarthrocarpum]